MDSDPARNYGTIPGKNTAKKLVYKGLASSAYGLLYQSLVNIN
jgi:hypothetical protein